MIISLLLNIHLFLIITEFEVRNVSYGSSLFMAQTRRAWAINKREKNEDP